jgi:hypothetical protein
MIDPISSARSARENLAQGLSALQSPGVPPDLSDLAEPIAQAMSALHHIETSQGAALAENAPVALDAVRRALSRLQAQPANHPAVNQAVEAVAGSLGIVHALSQQVGQPAPAAGPAYAPTQAAYPQPPAQAGWPAQPPAAQPQPAWPAQPAAPQPAWPAQPAAQPQAAAPAYARAAQPAYAPAAAAQPAYAPAAMQAAQPAYAPAPAAPQAAPAAPSASGSQPLRIDADLGAHSPTNFYKGLSGNDVIDSGGIFVATYQIPKIGQDLIIKVSLPGGYEFEALGVVKWTREAPNSGSDSSPGFGAQFTQISPEGRQLVYRYVRNREPLFHDDL